MLPSGTSTFLPSISTSIILDRSHELRFFVMHKTAPVLDVVLELGSIVFDERTHRHRRRVTEGANRSALNVVGQRIQKIKILGTPLTMFDPVNDAVEPPGAFAARRALAAAFFVIEIGKSLGGLDHAACFVHH